MQAAISHSPTSERSTSLRPNMSTVLSALAALDAVKDQVIVKCNHITTTPDELEKFISKPGYYDLQGRFTNPAGGMASHLDQLLAVSSTGHLRCVGIPQPSVSPFASAEYMIELLEFGHSRLREPESLRGVSRDQVVEIHSTMWREFLQGGQAAAWSAFDRLKAIL